MMYLIICKLNKAPWNRTLGQFNQGTLNDQIITCGSCGGARLKLPEKPNSEGVYNVIGHTVRLVDHD